MYNKITKVQKQNKNKIQFLTKKIKIKYNKIKRRKEIKNAFLG